MNAAVRKLENNVATLGLGTVALGAWSFVKLALYIAIVGIPFDNDTPDYVQIITKGIIWAVMFLDFAAYLFVGLSARGDSMGKPKSPAYLVLAVALIILDTVGIAITVASAFYTENSVISLLISSLLDISALVILLNMIVSAFRLRKMRKELHHES